MFREKLFTVFNRKSITVKVLNLPLLPLAQTITTFITMSKDNIIALIDFYEGNKQIDCQKVIEALAFSFVSAYRKKIQGSENIQNLRAEIEPKKGEITMYATLDVVEDDNITDSWNQVSISTAAKLKPAIQLGETIDINVTPKDFGRIALQTAKQTMNQRIRMAEKEVLYDEYKDRAGEVVSGVVRRFEKGDVWIDLGKFDGKMPQRERVFSEDYNIGDRIRVYVVAVENDVRGPEIILSRSHPNFIRRLFENEVVEIADRTVEIRGVARDAGQRTKIAVWSADSNVDPVGACVGLRGSRVKNIVNELNNEKIDIIRWYEDPEQFLKEALDSITAISCDFDVENKLVSMSFHEEDLKKVIGKRGQNIRLTSNLMGWKLKANKHEPEQDLQTKEFEEKIHNSADRLAEETGLPLDILETLINSGGSNLESLAEMDTSDLMAILEMPEEQVQPIFEQIQQQYKASQLS